MSYENTRGNHCSRPDQTNDRVLFLLEIRFRTQCEATGAAAERRRVGDAERGYYRLVLQHGNQRCRLRQQHAPPILQLQSGRSRQGHRICSRLEVQGHRRRLSRNHQRYRSSSYRRPREMRVGA